MVLWALKPPAIWQPDQRPRDPRNKGDPPSHVAMATERGSLQREIDLPGASPQVPCWLEEG